MYTLTIQDNGQTRTLRSAEIQRLVAERQPNHPNMMQHLSAIERIEARGIRYSNEDFDVLSDAHRFATEGVDAFQLKNDAPRHTPAKFQSQDKTRQRVLVDGMNCLPGQIDLF